MLLEVALVALGVLLLVAGGEAVVRGALAAARPLGISPLLAGIVIVGFGTSAPELVVSVSAALDGRHDVAVGNVVGSNIANVLLILGIAALVTPLAVPRDVFRRDVLSMVTATVLFLLAGTSTVLGRAESALFMLAFAGYLVWAYRGESRARRAGAFAPVEAAMARPVPPLGVARILFFLAGGFVLLVGGARVLVAGAVALAGSLGVSEAAIALTVVAVGTSLPELAVSLVAAVRGRVDLAVGNVLGSNIFNLLAILGIAGLLRPLSIHPRILAFDQWFMLASALGVGFFLFTGLRLERWEGGVLLGGYALYLVLTFARFAA